MSPLVACNFWLDLTRTNKRPWVIVEKLCNELEKQTQLVSSLQAGLRSAKQSNKKLQPVLWVLEEDYNEPEPGQSCFFQQKNHNKRFDNWSMPPLSVSLSMMLTFVVGKMHDCQKRWLLSFIATKVVYVNTS